MNAHLADPEAFLAQFSADLPGVDRNGALPNDIMWMPPGRHQINASRGGKPVSVEVNVDEEAARRVAQSHSDYSAAAGGGEEDLPYLDFNHDDREASGHPTEIYWGGSDPQKGGIRAKVSWTSAGKTALLGKNYRRFSPSFYLDSEGKVTGAPVNFGGLVNRAAFKRIAPVIAKSTEIAKVVDPSVGFLEKAELVARARNLEIHQAVDALAHERPDLYLEYRAGLGLGGKRDNERELNRLRSTAARWQAATNDEFLIRAQALSDATDLSIVDAFRQVCASSPALYERYRARLHGREPLDAGAIAVVQSKAEQSPFYLKAKAIAEARSVDISKAFEIVAREEPGLYDNYRNNL